MKGHEDTRERALECKQERVQGYMDVKVKGCEGTRVKGHNFDKSMCS